ncbi:MAG TPA: glutaredoxin family protein [Bryobacteraceae bacterium]|jgi:mycoredoxin
MKTVTVYGADWCPLTKRAIAHLKHMKVDFQYIDIDQNPRAARWVREQNGGKEIKPTIDIGGEVLSEPSDAELEAAVL